MNDNTKPEFFALWSVRQLQVECARLNGVLKETIEIAEKALQPKLADLPSCELCGADPMTANCNNAGCS